MYFPFLMVVMSSSSGLAEDSMCLVSMQMIYRYVFIDCVLVCSGRVLLDVPETLVPKAKSDLLWVHPIQLCDWCRSKTKTKKKGYHLQLQEPWCDGVYSQPPRGFLVIEQSTLNDKSNHYLPAQQSQCVTLTFSCSSFHGIHVIFGGWIPQFNINNFPILLLTSAAHWQLPFIFLFI